MNLPEALEKARRILQEEQSAPTLTYTYVSDGWPDVSHLAEAVPQGFNTSSAGTWVLIQERSKRARPVHEDPKAFKFSSVNFDLLILIFNQVIQSDRSAFISSLVAHVEQPVPSRRSNIPIGYYPHYAREVSCLPLIAEFCIRTGHLKELLEATKKPQFPTNSLAMMLMEIEEMIALNFNLFSDSELQTIPTQFLPLREIARRQTWAESREGGGGLVVKNQYYVSGYKEEGNAIIGLIDVITEQCRKARFFYLKGELQELPNLEIESDKIKVEGFLVKLGFSSKMLGALDAAEQDYRSTSTTFELKNCLSHLRTFLEHLHRDAAKAVPSTPGVVVEDKWSPATIYLRQQGFFTQKHEDFIMKFYTLISDEGAHALGAEREYARLLRNVVIEYGVMFLTVLDQRGVRLS
jgi:hypothetical protein